MKKRAPIYLLIGLGVLISLATLLIYNSPLRASKTIPAYNHAFDSYLAAFTAGEISKQSDVTVQFAHAIVDSTQIGQELDVNWFQMDPLAQGKLYWTDTRTLSFEPATPLASKTLYSVQLEMEALMPDIDPTLSFFNFYFRTQPQSFKMEILGNTSSDDVDGKWQNITGQIQALDVEEAEAIRQMTSAELNGKSYPIRWEDVEAGKTFHFAIDSVERKTESQQLAISWDASEIDLPGKGTEIIEIPGFGDFQTTHIKAFNGSSPYVQVTFSEPLLAQQNLNGLIRIGTQPLTFLIEGNQVKVFPKRRIRTDVEVEVLAGIQNKKGHQTQKQLKQTLQFQSEKPSLKLVGKGVILPQSCLLYTSPSPRDRTRSRMPSSA